VCKRSPNAALFFSRNGAEGAHIFEALLLTFLLDKHILRAMGARWDIKKQNKR